MARKSKPIEEKINEQQKVVDKMKEKYDAAVAKLEALKKELDEQKDKELLDVIKASKKSSEEIMAFLQGE